VCVCVCLCVCVCVCVYCLLAQLFVYKNVVQETYAKMVWGLGFQVW